MKADVVIGAGFGDEGKGLMTDYLASQYDESIVIRFNGGAQAGHTVVTPDGQGHIFSHFGSGSYNNSHTYLSQFFIVNPILFFKEALSFEITGVRFPKVMIHPDAMVSTPFDMMLNQIMAKENSCGCGINETILRHNAGFAISARNFKSPDWVLKDLLNEIRDVYFTARLEQLGITLNDEYMEFFYGKNIITNWIEEVREMDKFVSIGRLKPTKTPLIFEGAQGLLLDNDFDVEFGTPTKTGLPNVITLAKELNIDTLDVNYMVRAYLTRHGGGRFDAEDKLLSYDDITNKTNKYQGGLRFGRFDQNLITAVIELDKPDFPTTRRLVVTHIDQMPAYMEYVDHHGLINTTHRANFANQMATAMGLDSFGISVGPTRKDVVCHTGLA